MRWTLSSVTRATTIVFRIISRLFVSEDATRRTSGHMQAFFSRVAAVLDGEAGLFSLADAHRLQTILCISPALFPLRALQKYPHILTPT